MMGARLTRLVTGTLLAMALGAAAGAEVIDRVLAIVGGQVVTLSDAHAVLALKRVDPADEPDPIGAALSYLIDRRLVLAEVDRYMPPEPDETAIEKRIAAIRSALAPDAAFAPALARVALDETRLRALARDDLRIDIYLDQRFAALVPGDDDVERYYREHAADFTREGVLAPLEDVRGEARRRLAAERRTRLIAQWIADLRRRVDVSVLYLPAKPGAPR